MKKYEKKQVTVVIDMAYLRTFLDALDGMNISGYTALPAIAGAGDNGVWKKDKLPSEAGSKAVIYLVLDESKLDSLLETITPAIEENIGIVVINDVTVLRREKF